MKNDEVSDVKLRQVFKEWVLESNLDPKQVFAIAAKNGLYTKQRDKELRDEGKHNTQKTEPSQTKQSPTNEHDEQQAKASKFQRTFGEHSSWTADKRETAWISNEQSWRHEHKWKRWNWEKQDSAWTNYTWQENKHTASASAASSSWQQAPTTHHSGSSSSRQHSPQTLTTNPETKRNVTLLPNTHSHNEQKEQATSESKLQWTPTLKRTRDTRIYDTRLNPQSDKEEYQHKDWKKKW